MIFSRHFFRSIVCLLPALLIFSAKGFAQPTNDNCSNARGLCANSIVSGSNVGATAESCLNCADSSAVLNTCFGNVNNTVWYSFTTNSSGGQASVTLSNISCLVAPGQDNNLEVAILSAGAACDPASYTSFGCSSSSGSSLNIPLSGLTASSQFFIVINGDLSGAGINAAAECDFSITVSGPAVQFQVSHTVTSQNCGATDGEVTITATSGGQPPYQYNIGSGFQTGTTFSNLSAGTYFLTVLDASGCSSIADTIVIGISGAPSNATAVITNASCGNADGQIEIQNVTSGNLPLNYSLNGGLGQGSPVFSNLNAGTYSVLITDSQGCTEEVNNIIVSSNGGMDSVTIATTSADCGSSNGSIVVSPFGGTAPFAYSLNGGSPQAGSSFQSLAPGTYTVLVTDNGSCTYQVEALVEQLPPNNIPQITIFSTGNPSCIGDPISFSASTQNAGSGLNFLWLINGNPVPGANGPDSTFTPGTINSGDVVTCILITSDPCNNPSSLTSNQITQVILPITTPTVTLANSTTTACSNEPVMFTVSQNGCNNPSFSWMANGSVIASTVDSTLQTTLSSDAAVSVEVSCADACSTPSTSNTVNITVTEIEANAGPDQVIGEGQTAQLTGSGGGTYSWQPSSSLSNPNVSNPIASPGSTTPYTLTVTLNGCTDTDEVTIFVVPLISVPNTFTPNGDGVNDTWEIQNIELYPNARVTIYDRWGQRVYNSTGYSNNNGWDGTNNGGKLPAATYYYVIELKGTSSGDGNNYSGSVTIVY